MAQNSRIASNFWTQAIRLIALPERKKHPPDAAMKTIYAFKEGKKK